MAEGEVAPPICPSEASLVFYRCINAVELALKIPAARGLISRAVRVSSFNIQYQFLHDERAFRKRTRLLICIEVRLFNVDVMKLGETGFSVIQSIWRHWSTKEHPFAVPCRSLHLAVRSPDSTPRFFLHGGGRLAL